LNIHVREKNIAKCQNKEDASPKWLCLPMAINLGQFGNWNVSATGIHPEISIKGIAHSVNFKIKNFSVAAARLRSAFAQL
jgi:hypothetical protein